MSRLTPGAGRHIRLCGVSVEVRSENPAFSAYLDKHFPPSTNSFSTATPDHDQMDGGNPSSQPIPACGIHRRVSHPTHHQPGPRNDLGDRITQGFPEKTAAASGPVQEPREGHAREPVAVISLVRWTEGPRPKLDAAEVFPDWEAGELIDRYVHAGPGGLLWLRVDDVPQLAIASRCQDDHRQIEVRYHFTLGAGPFMEPLKRLARWRWLPAKRRHRFSTIVYYAVYYPVWWHLECNDRGYPLHAGAVTIGDKAIVLAGLPGAGKSTLAAGFLDLAEAALLSDNIVLHDGTHIWGCYEPLLLGEHGAANATALSETGQHHAFNRSSYHAPHLGRRFSPAAVVILCRGEKTELEPLESSQCFRILLGINEAAKEMRRYHVFSAIFSIAELRGLECAEARTRRLEQLIRPLPCFRLHLREGAPKEAIAELVKLAGSRLEVQV